MSNDTKKSVIKGELINYGYAPYKDNPENSQSYFVELKHENGLVDKKWGADLERALNESNAQIGDTVILNDKGKQPVSIPDPEDPTKSKVVNKNLWEVEKYEPLQEYPNSIEKDNEREQQTEQTKKTKENVKDTVKPVPHFSEFDSELPSNIKNNYIAITKNRFLSDQKTNYYDKDDKEQVNIAFEDRNKSLHTSRQDDKTVYAMLDMAQSKGWSSIKLKGTEEFKQKVWLEASLRGIEVKGYTPSEKDLAELQAKQAERTTNQVEGVGTSLKPQAQTKTESESVKEEAEKTKEKEPIINAKDIIWEAAAVAVTPPPFQPVVAGAFLINDAIAVKEAVQDYFSEKGKENSKSAEEIKMNIRQIVQDGYKDGTITSRDELVKELKEKGYEVKENEKSIRVSLPNGDQAVNLKGEMFTKGYDAIKSLKERLEPENLKKTYPTLKDSDIVHITAYKNKLFEDNKQFDNPKILQTSLVQLEQGVKSLASGKNLNLPDVPTVEHKPDIEVRTTDNHDKSRQM